MGDSPAGLAAYILEKFTTATNPNYRQTMDGGLKESFTYDSLLDNIMYYWLNNAMTTSMRLYSETFNKKYFTSELKRSTKKQKQKKIKIIFKGKSKIVIVSFTEC